MYFRCLSALLLFWLSSRGLSARVLRVCADPNNLPFSNKAQQGFENRLAELVARDLKADLKYTWWAERKGFLENSLDADLCDVVMGVPSTLNSVLTTGPYYLSTYVFVARRDRLWDISSLTDPRLERMRIGMHVVGEDYAPPAHFLARRGLTSQIAGFSLYGAAGDPNPPARLIDAVVRGEVDLAIVWGPFAGYFSKRQPVPLVITPVSPNRFLEIPFTYGISAAVRKDNRSLHFEVQASLTRHCRAIIALLADYGIPQVSEDEPRCDSSQPAAISLR